MESLSSIAATHNIKLNRESILGEKNTLCADKKTKIAAK